MFFLNTINLNGYSFKKEGSIRVKAQDYRIVISEFKILAGYNVQFQTNTHWKGMNPLILPAMG